MVSQMYHKDGEYTIQCEGREWVHEGGHSKLGSLRQAVAEDGIRGGLVVFRASCTRILDVILHIKELEEILSNSAF